MIKILRYFFFFVGVLGALIGIPLHISTFFGFDPRQFSELLWIGIQLSSGVIVIGLLLSKYLAPENIQSQFLTQILILAGFFWFYALINWAFTNTYFSQDALPKIINGEPVLYTHGHVVRRLTPLEYKAQLVYVSRYFSGHWMAFFLTAIALFGPSRERLRGLSLKMEF